MNAHASDQHVLVLGGDNQFAYTLRRTSRQRTVGIVVEPDGRICVLAPASVTLHRVEQIMRRRAQWIRRQQREVEALPPPPLPREWVSGETHRYLGRQYRLKLLTASDESVRLLGAFFVVRVRDRNDRERVRSLMKSWYCSHTKALLEARMDRILTSTTWLTSKPACITIRKLRTRWGSTSPSGRISFNRDLGQLPLSCIDYVIAHELVHLKIPNHSPAFWRMLERVLPDWRRRRQRLAMVEL